MDKIKAIRGINLFITVMFFVCFLVIFGYDYANFSDIHPGVEPRYWFLDEDFDAPMSLKGKLMIVSIILSAIALVGYLIIAKGIVDIRKKKEDKYISTLILNSTLFFAYARIVEVFYIPSDSSFFGINYIGQFHLAFEATGFALFIVFTFQIFLAEILKDNDKLVNRVLSIGYASSLIAIGGILSYPIQSSMKTPQECCLQLF